LQHPYFCENSLRFLQISVEHLLLTPREFISHPLGPPHTIVMCDGGTSQCRDICTHGQAPAKMPGDASRFQPFGTGGLQVLARGMREVSLRMFPSTARRSECFTDEWAAGPPPPVPPPAGRRPPVAPPPPPPPPPGRPRRRCLARALVHQPAGCRRGGVLLMTMPCIL